MNDVEKLVEFQFKPLAVCPLPPRPKRIMVINKATGKKEYRYEQELKKTFGNTTVQIIASNEYGLPHGRDILVILYLIKKALDQNNKGIIKTKSPIRDYLKMFKLDSSQQGYEEAIRRFKRVRKATFYWTEESKDGKKGKDEKNAKNAKNVKDGKDGKENSLSYQIIRRWSVYFDDIDRSNLFDSFIELDPVFWEYISKKRIPYDLSTVQELKDRISVLNLYLWLVYRAYEIWNNQKNKPVFIPFFGPNGLKSQLSSNITRNSDFKRKMIEKYIPLLKYVWKDCPIYLLKETKTTAKDLRRNKVYQDGMLIQIDSVNQLHISPHWPKKLRQAREEAKNANKEDEKRILEKDELKKAEKELDKIISSLKKIRLDIKSGEVVKVFKAIQEGVGLLNRQEELEERIEELKKPASRMKKNKGPRELVEKEEPIGLVTRQVDQVNDSQGKEKN